MTPAESGRAGLGDGEVFVEMHEKKQLPVSVFWAGRNWGLAERRHGILQAKVPRLSTLENQGLPTRDNLPRSRGPKWKSRFNVAAKPGADHRLVIAERAPC
jgi:hypothetical protein